MKILLFAAQLLLAAPAAPTPMQAAAALLRWTPPSSWTASEYANAGGSDAVVVYEKGIDRIEIKIFGAPRSFYRTPAAFMAGPGATTMGRAPVRSGSARVAGASVAVYRRRYPLPEGSPDGFSAPRLGREAFCVLPPFPDGRFAVLSYARESPVPDVAGVADKAWAAFLSSVSRVRKP